MDPAQYIYWTYWTIVRLEGKIDRLTASVAAVSKALGVLQAQEALAMAKMKAEIDDLQSAVTEIKTADGSIITLCQTMSDQLKTMAQNATDLATLKAQVADYAGQLHSEASTVAAAVVANTPAAPAPAAPPADGGVQPQAKK